MDTPPLRYNNNTRMVYITCPFAAETLVCLFCHRGFHLSDDRPPWFFFCVRWRPDAARVVNIFVKHRPRMIRYHRGYNIVHRLVVQWMLKTRTSATYSIRTCVLGFRRWWMKQESATNRRRLLTHITHWGTSKRCLTPLVLYKLYVCLLVVLAAVCGGWSKLKSR